jgi:tryptophan synthase alpha chain
MNRIDATFKRLQANNKKLFSPYITAGDPLPGLTVDLMHAMVDKGADLLELGIPFSDPMAEGVVIQKAMERALKHHIGIQNVLDMVRLFRKKDSETPIVLMGYLNPIEQYGHEQFAHDASNAGVDGTIIVDLPPEESHDVVAIWDKHNIYPIYLCSPTTSAKRMSLISEYAKGYLYYVSLKGVTGSAQQSLEAVREEYLSKKSQVALPLMVGFGIKTPEMAASMAQFSDGVIVGAALITEFIQAYDAGHSPIAAAGDFVAAMRQAIDG